MSNITLLPLPTSFPVIDPRGKLAYQLRYGTAIDDAVAASAVTHPVNDDLNKFPDGLGTYTKGLKQTSPGIVDAASFEAFLEACGVHTGPVPVGDLENAKIVRGGSAKLNGPRGAFAWQNIGKDSEAYGGQVVPAAPALFSEEYAIELVELYWASLLRDVPFESYVQDPTAKAAANELTALAAAYPGMYKGPFNGSNQVTPELLFRGGFNAPMKINYFKGEEVGPYLSQFCLIPTVLGRLSVDQRIKTYSQGQDFMITPGEWFNIQNGGSPTSMGVFDPTPRYIRCGRDCAAYTEVDELYQAYLIAYLVANTVGLPTNPGNPYRTYVNDKPFSTFGGPDISATLGAVARAAINAVWYQKWQVHLRHRPESGGGIVQMWKDNQLSATDKAKLTHIDIVLNSEALKRSHARYGSWLLSQAFPEGSPTHPAYPTGHGTVAGACITVLKFFFDGDAPFTDRVVPSPDGLSLNGYNGPGPLTVNGELHKLAHNVSFGHGIHAGIHWRSDTDYSILLGEEVAINYLLDQMYSYQENFDITITKIDGSSKQFKNF
jgi:hypothetical protein